ncbi:MAG: DUF4242 domain-containing protein [Actinomycetales bacterium]
MARYIIERDLPGAGSLSEKELHDISAKSNEVLAGMENIDWVESYVSDDKFYCVYDADDPEKIREHAAAGGFPCNRISEVKGVISPATGR